MIKEDWKNELINKYGYKENEFVEDEKLFVEKSPMFTIYGEKPIYIDILDATEKVGDEIEDRLKYFDDIDLVQFLEDISTIFGVRFSISEDKALKFLRRFSNKMSQHCKEEDKE